MEAESPMMQASKPTEVVEENKELKIIESKTYEIIIDNSTYKIELSKSENKGLIIILYCYLFTNRFSHNE